MVQIARRIKITPDLMFAMNGINSSVPFITEMRCSDFPTECKNGGYVSYIRDTCTCRCPEGLNPVTGCSTVYRGGRILRTQPFETHLYTSIFVFWTRSKRIHFNSLIYKDGSVHCRRWTPRSHLAVRRVFNFKTSGWLSRRI